MTQTALLPHHMDLKCVMRTQANNRTWAQVTKCMMKYNKMYVTGGSMFDVEPSDRSVCSIEYLDIGLMSTRVAEQSPCLYVYVDFASQAIIGPHGTISAFVSIGKVF